MSLRTELLIHGYDAGEDRLLSVLSFLETQELTCIADFEGESVCSWCLGGYMWHLAGAPPFRWARGSEKLLVEDIEFLQKARLSCSVSPFAARMAHVRGGGQGHPLGQEEACREKGMGVGSCVASVCVPC